MGGERVGRLISAILALGLAAASSATCAGAASDPLAGTVLALDRSIDALTDPSVDFRTVLQRLVSRLPSGADSSVGAAIRRFLNRAPVAGADFQCGPGFVRLRARQELIRLEERLLKTAMGVAEPQFCYAAPFAVDLSRVPNAVEIYGYDFDLVPVEMFLVATDGYHDVSSALIPRTHYHMTLALGERGVRLPPNAQLLGLTWGHLIHHAIPVAGPRTPFCSCTIEEIPAGRSVEQAPPLVRRDAHPVAKPGSVAAWANAVVDYEMNELSATVCMTVAESAGDRAVRSGCVRAFILTVDADRIIEGVFGRPEGRATYSRSVGQRAEIEAPNGAELIHRWSFAGLDGDSAGPRVTVELSKIRLVTTLGEGCISPIAYLEARRTGAMSPVTVRALDRQLSKLDPEIAGLRPRFAPAIR